MYTLVLSFKPTVARRTVTSCKSIFGVSGGLVSVQFTFLL
jgi:hypothetical protein